MLTRSRIKTIVDIALPIAIGSSASFIMVFVDLAMVGRLGNNALAAVGLAGFSFAIVIALISGIVPAVQGITARRVGEGSKEPICLALNGGLLLAAIVAVPMTVGGYLIAPALIGLTSSDANVVAEGVPYMRALLMGVLAMGMSAAFQGFWNGLARVKIFMINLIMINCLNIFLNYVFIFGNLGAPALGTEGAGIATTCASYFGALFYFAVTLYSYRDQGFLKVWPKKSLIQTMIEIGLPGAAQDIFFSLGYIVFYWIIGMVGTAELAVVNVLTRISMLLIIFSEALEDAATTMVSRTLGEGDPDGAAAWGWDIAKIGVIFVTLLGLPLLLFPEWSLSLFIVDPETVAMGKIPAQITGGLTGVVSIIMIFAGTLVSLGDGKRVLLVSLTTQWLIFLPAVWFVGVYLGYGLLEISIIQAAYGLIAAALIVALWADGRWKTIQI